MIRWQLAKKRNSFVDVKSKTITQNNIDVSQDSLIFELPLNRTIRSLVIETIGFCYYIPHLIVILTTRVERMLLRYGN